MPTMTPAFSAAVIAADNFVLLTLRIVNPPRQDEFEPRNAMGAASHDFKQCNLTAAAFWAATKTRCGLTAWFYMDHSRASACGCALRGAPAPPLPATKVLQRPRIFRTLEIDR